MTAHRISTAPLAALLGALLLTGMTAPAWADTDKTPPGDPCGSGPGKGTGNPCGGNNGNPGTQGNAGKGGGQPEFVPIDLPPEDNRGVFVSQVGDTNRATIVQGTASSYARVVQSGEGNTVGVEQGAQGTHYASIAQDGDSNLAIAAQEGTGRTVLLLAQQGNGNEALVRQADTGPAYSAAAIQQTGNGNGISLVQDGSDNQARLTQDGDDNRMDAIQLGTGNRLGWSQTGDGLSGTQVVQTGNGNLQITQGVGAQFAPPPTPGG